MKIYLETSVIIIKLFGVSSEQEKYRYPFVEYLFELINEKRVNAITFFLSVSFDTTP